MTQQEIERLNMDIGLWMAQIDTEAPMSGDLDSTYRLMMRVQDALRALTAAPTEGAIPRFDMHAHLARQREWSERTFGPGARTVGVIDHIRKELTEIEADPADVSEWIDVVTLALDGAWRAGFSPEQIVAAIVAKQTKNEGRNWPDWRTAATDRAIEHDRTNDAAPKATEGAAQALQQALEVCVLRAEFRTTSHPTDYQQGYVDGCDACAARIKELITDLASPIAPPTEQGRNDVIAFDKGTGMSA